MDESTNTPTKLVLPGFGGSGPDHWQSIFEREIPGCERVGQRDWDNPVLVEWMDRLTDAVERQPAPPVLIAHSLACSLVAHYAASSGPPVAGALLVSPADVDEISDFYTELESFAPMPLNALPFPTTVVASTDDMYVLPDRAKLFAESWGSELVVLEGAGHINADSGYGPWPRGVECLNALIARLA